MAKKKVLYYHIDGHLDFENALLRKWGVADIDLVEAEKTTNNMIEAARDADGLVVEYQPISREIIGRLPRLKIISLQAIGVDNIDLQAATEHGICVTNCPGFCSEEVALHTVGLIIDLARKITLLDRTVRSGGWDPLYGYRTHRLSGRTIGLYFFGSIPKMMMPLLKALNLKVLVYAPTKSARFLAGYGAEKAESFDELLRRSDILSLHCPLIESTVHLISDRELKMMKKSAFLINSARGRVVDEAALVRALKAGEIQAAAVDVIEDETTEQSALFGLENTVITPHAAFISEDSYYAARRIALEQLVQRLSKNLRPANLVNHQVKVN
ncbi:C-terminal binding protein [Sporolactobacillus sp. KGMB 08714]|uniref:C-terminal binding protein n=1 Tax=Sporolactobacillus sp. KGMB 08714 TaxID=3064704 RepID=UPI002FBE40DA